ncbi:putative tricarboxylic transport membrane protein [Streptosporangium subroseum]|uniref:Putative tricarboxylic transport membrane protein n=1 Tax=Streptosporangium subroseum TaxID=106412 RepID=A0A239DN16_9ACTN|nr:tripartite tricarboxylate transporter substrate-binding protein [Streptosporangium subroseum]SNS33539.1 putative tricarboxylic transport membrane protein [Streptosporangium subroseum]
MRRRGFFAFAAGIMVVAGCGSTRTSGASTANRLSIIAPMAHGQSWDLAVRTLATVLVEAKLARTVGVSNHPGGLDAATMNTFSAAHGPFMSDGQLLLTGMPMVAGAEITNAAAVVDSTTPLARLIGDWAALVVPANSNLRTFDDFVAVLRRDPAGLVVGGRSTGGSDHVLYGMIGKCLGVDARLLEYSGYPGWSETVEALYDGRVAAILGSARSFKKEIAAHRMRPLVVSSGQRIDGIDAPTLMELEVRLEYSDWCGLLGPRDMRPEDRDAAVALCDRLDATPRWQEVCAANDWNRVYLSGEDFRQWLVTETGRTRGVLYDLGLLKSSSTRCRGGCVKRP